MTKKVPAKWKGLTLKQKIFWGTAGISIGLVLLVTLFAMKTTYDSLYSQVISLRHMSIGWLEERLELSLKEYSDQFYALEVDKQTKADIQQWCTPGGKLDYEARWRLITAINAIISMDANINSMELYNLQNDTVLTAKRSGAALNDTAKRLALWKGRDPSLQTNMVLMREGNEILVMHQINRFETNSPLALAVIRLKPAAFADLLNNIRSSADESLLMLNDAGQLVAAIENSTKAWDESEIKKLVATIQEAGAAHTAIGARQRHRLTTSANAACRFAGGCIRPFRCAGFSSFVYAHC